MTLGEALRDIGSRPFELFIRRWNWKSAALSACLRAILFIIVNRKAGMNAALTAGAVEFAYRVATSGFFGSITQVFRQVQPAWIATAATLIVLPVVNQFLDFLVHWWQGTPFLAKSIITSTVMTAFAALFNLHAQREGAFVVGPEGRSFAADLKRLPGLLLSFVLVIPRAVLGMARGRAERDRVPSRPA
jgi:hypothetical protein